MNDIRKSHELSFKIVRVITIVVSNPVNFLVNAGLWRQSTASGYSLTSRFAAILLLSPPSYNLYTLAHTISKLMIFVLLLTKYIPTNEWLLITSKQIVIPLKFSYTSSLFVGHVCCCQVSPITILFITILFIRIIRNILPTFNKTWLADEALIIEIVAIFPLF